MARLDSLARGELLRMRLVVAATLLLRRRRRADVGREHLLDDAFLGLAIGRRRLGASNVPWHQPELACALEEQFAYRQRPPRRGVRVGRTGMQRGLHSDRGGGNDRVVDGNRHRGAPLRRLAFGPASA